MKSQPDRLAPKPDVLECRRFVIFAANKPDNPLVKVLDQLEANPRRSARINIFSLVNPPQ